MHSCVSNIFIGDTIPWGGVPVPCGATRFNLSRHRFGEQNDGQCHTICDVRWLRYEALIHVGPVDMHVFIGIDIHHIVRAPGVWPFCELLDGSLRMQHERNTHRHIMLDHGYVTVKELACHRDRIALVRVWC